MHFVCTKEHPWKGEPGQVEHVDAREVGEQLDGWPGGDIIQLQCPNCGHKWKQELPQ